MNQENEILRKADGLNLKLHNQLLELRNMNNTAKNLKTLLDTEYFDQYESVGVNYYRLKGLVDGRVINFLEMIDDITQNIVNTQNSLTQEIQNIISTINDWEKQAKQTS